MCFVSTSKILAQKEHNLCVTLRNYFQSDSFTKDFGTLIWNPTLGFTWSFVQTYYFGRRGLVPGEIALETENGKLSFEFQFFNNSYNAFVLIFPKEARMKSKLTTPRDTIHS